MIQNRVLDDCSRIPSEGPLPGDHLIKDEAEGKQISASIQLLPAHLLRGHVTRRAHSYPRPGERQCLIGCGARSPMLAARAASYFALARFAGGDHLRDAEVENLGDTPLGDKDVGGFDVAMNDSLVMRRLQARDYVDGELQDLLEWEQAALVTGAIRQHVSKIPAVQQRHDDEGSPFLFAELKDRADVGMIQRRHGASLSFETRNGLFVFSQLLRKKL